MRSSALALAALLLTAPPTKRAEFARFPAEARLEGAPAEPDTRSGAAHRYRTLLREEAAEGPNFNGHYRVIRWGCGTNCINWAILDLKAGRTWFAPDLLSSCPSGVGDGDYFEHLVDSALLYAYDCADLPRRDRLFDTRRVYVWQAGHLKLLRTEAAP